MLIRGPFSDYIPSHDKKYYHDSHYIFIQIVYSDMNSKTGIHSDNHIIRYEYLSYRYCKNIMAIKIFLSTYTTTKKHLTKLGCLNCDIGSTIAVRLRQSSINSSAKSSLTESTGHKLQFQPKLCRPAIAINAVQF